VVFVTFALLAWAGSPAQCQQEREPKSAVTPLSATVEGTLMLVTMRDLDLINPAIGGGRPFISPQTSSYAGLFRISGLPSRNIRVTYLVYEDLEEKNGNGGQIEARYLLSGFPQDNQIQSILYAPTGEIDIRLGPDGFFYLWLGAELNLSNALPGIYESEFIIEMEYT
jgi:hypothetical protein